MYPDQKYHVVNTTHILNIITSFQVIVMADIQQITDALQKGLELVVRASF